LAFVVFYFYIFIGKEPAGGKPAVKAIAAVPDVFREGETFYNG